jgi:hypothetical protein
MGMSCYDAFMPGMEWMLMTGWEYEAELGILEFCVTAGFVAWFMGLVGSWNLNAIWSMHLAVYTVFF